MCGRVASSKASELASGRLASLGYRDGDVVPDLHPLADGQMVTLLCMTVPKP
jgi:hypothetical protein